MISFILRSWSILLQTVAGASCSVFLFILLTDSAQALIDTNLNGVSDLWEKTYNSGNLFTNFNSLADTDGDGWTNGTEAISGTNPLDQIAPQGIIPLQIIQTPAVYTTGPNGEPQIFTPAAISITWPTLTGKQYTLFTSVDLTPGSWLAIDNDTPRIGTTAPMGNAFSISQTQGNSAPSMFYRLAINDADSDGDTLTNHEEATLATDPFSPDTDLDGFPDNTDPAPLSSATLTDPDGAGLVNAQNIPLSIANGLLGRWNLEDHQIISNPPAGYTPFQYPDSAGANPATAFSVFPHLEGMVSKATNHAGGYLSIPTAVLGTQKIYTTAFWALLEPGSISAANGAPVALFSHHQRIPWLINNVPQWGRYTEQLNGLWFEKSGSQERLRAGTHIYTNHLNGVPTAGTTTSLGINILRDAGTADDGKWHHYTFVHHDATKTLYIDGVLVGTATHTPATISINSIYSGISLGRISGPSPAATGYLQGTSPTRGRMDRLRIWNRPLTQAEATALYREDIDKDDLWDITENNRLWRDNNSDGLQTTTERAFSSSPFTWQAITSDTDDDGLTDVQEQTQGTKIDDPDTDGDLLPDGWEVSYQLNPLIPNDPNDDTDQDALTLLNEYRYNTNPILANTDGDSQNDSIEVNQGSNPNDNSDGGAPVPPEQQLSILLGIGDKSGSHSEDYVLNCYRLDPTTGQETRIYTLRSGGYGLYKEETQTIFKKGETYTFQIDWQSSNLDYQSAAPGVSAEGPDYDYTFKVQPQGSNTGILIDAYDPKTKTIGNPILAEDASDVATTEAEFKQNYENKRVSLLQVEVVNANRQKVGELTVSDMEDSLVEAGNIGIDPEPHIGLAGDSDRFHLRIPGLDGNHQVTVKLATIDNPDPSYNDDATIVKLQKIQGVGYESLGQVLVSGAIDAAISTYEEITLDNPDPTSKRKRTHNIQLGGKVQITELKIGSLERAIDLQIPVPVKKTIGLNIVIMSDAGNPDVTAEIKSANEIYASTGVKVVLNGAPITQPPPPITNINTQGPGSTVASDDISDGRRFISAYGTISNVDDIHVFYVLQCQKTHGGNTTQGFAFIKRQLPTPPNPNLPETTQVGDTNNIFISKTHASFVTLAHELAHVLTNAGHYGSANGLYDYRPNASTVNGLHNLMSDDRRNSAETDKITAKKRLYEEQRQMIFAP